MKRILVLGGRSHEAATVESWYRNEYGNGRVEIRHYQLDHGFDAERVISALREWAQEVVAVGRGYDERHDHWLGFLLGIWRGRGVLLSRIRFSWADSPIPAYLCTFGLSYPTIHALLTSVAETWQQVDEITRGEPLPARSRQRVFRVKITHDDLDMLSHGESRLVNAETDTLIQQFLPLYLSPHNCNRVGAARPMSVQVILNDHALNCLWEGKEWCQVEGNVSTALEVVIAPPGPLYPSGSRVRLPNLKNGIAGLPTFGTVMAVGMDEAKKKYKRPVRQHLYRVAMDYGGHVIATVDDLVAAPIPDAADGENGHTP